MNLRNGISSAFLLASLLLSVDAQAQSSCDAASVIDPAIASAAASNQCLADGDYINSAVLISSVIEEKSCKGARGRAEKLMTGMKLLKGAGVNLLPDGVSPKEFRKALYVALKAKCKPDNGGGHEEPTPVPGGALTVQQVVELLNQHCRSDSQSINCACAVEKTNYMRERGYASNDVIAGALSSVGCSQ